MHIGKKIIILFDKVDTIDYFFRNSSHVLCVQKNMV